MKQIKKIITGLFTLLVIACNNTPKQASIEGHIKNLPKEITEVVLRTKDTSKKIKIENGIFKDTISINGEFVFLQIGKEGKTLFLNKKSQLKIEVDLTNFDETLVFEGEGKKVNDYILNREKITYKVFEQLDSINKLSSENFESYLNKMSGDVNSLLAKNKDIDPIVIKGEKENLPLFINNIRKQYNSVNNKTTGLNLGDAAPKFNYDNYKGGKTSLTNLKGNLVYIDIWATWCGPCKAEIPYLKKLEKKYHGKKIKFVSISIDSPNTKDKWQKMIAEKHMSGVQLFANGDNSLMEAYQVSGIPRFILIDKNGNILNTNAPRPSSGTALESLINSNL